MRYGIAVAKSFESSGYEVVLTTRKHLDTLPLAEFLEKKIMVVGRYNPKSLLTRLKENVQRQSFFCNFFGKNAPSVAISHGSVDLCRIAFGLGIPIITTFDTIYADAVNRLTLPLSNYIVHSKAIPKKIFRIYGCSKETIPFDGVDEVAWIKNFKPAIQYDFGKPLIVIRQFEEKAAYANEKVDLFILAKKLTKIGKVVFLSRYQRKSHSIKNLFVPKKFVDSASLVAQADLFLGVGGTITREAALQGTPAIVIEKLSDQHVNDYLSRKGFPIFKVKISEVIKLSKKLLGEKREVKHLVAKLENPVKVILRLGKRLLGKN
jgi:predicted glycosyltransferase